MKRHYSLQENPGLGEGGLYYYLHLLAKALDALGSNKSSTSRESLTTGGTN